MWCGERKIKREMKREPDPGYGPDYPYQTHTPCSLLGVILTFGLFHDLNLYS